MVKTYDIKQKSETWEDGVPTLTWTVYETRKIDLQPLKWEEAESAKVKIGGEIYVPAMRGWLSFDSNVTAANYITADSGTTDHIVLRAYKYEDHVEIDTQEVHENG